MGIDSLWSLLKQETGTSEQPLSSLAGKILAVDISIWILEAQSIANMKNAVAKPFLRTVFFRVLKLARHGVRLVCVVDGIAPALKFGGDKRRTLAAKERVENAQRAAQGLGPIRNRPLGMDKRRCAQFSQWNAECVQLLRVLGVPVVELSLGEGEAKCAQLNEQGLVHACVTSDSDAFLFGARQVIKSLDCTSETIVSVSAAEIDKRLGLRRNKLVCLALLTGGDYSQEGVHGIGPKKACQLLSCFDEHAVIDVLRTWLRDKEQHKPDYEAFSDVQLKKEMAHFGMKELSRRQMIQRLSSLWDEMHPDVAVDVDESETKSKTQKKTKKKRESKDTDTETETDDDGKSAFILTDPEEKAKCIGRRRQEFVRRYCLDEFERVLDAYLRPKLVAKPQSRVHSPSNANIGDWPKFDESALQAFIVEHDGSLPENAIEKTREAAVGLWLWRRANENTSTNTSADTDADTKNHRMSSSSVGSGSGSHSHARSLSMDSDSGTHSHSRSQSSTNTQSGFLDVGFEFEPVRVLKQRLIKSQTMFDVLWRRKQTQTTTTTTTQTTSTTDEQHEFTTCEPGHLVEAALANLVSKFKIDKQSNKEKKKKEQADARKQRDKAKREAKKAEKQTQNMDDGEHADGLSQSTLSFAKPVSVSASVSASTTNETVTLDDDEFYLTPPDRDTDKTKADREAPKRSSKAKVTRTKPKSTNTTNSNADSEHTASPSAARVLFASQSSNPTTTQTTATAQQKQQQTQKPQTQTSSPTASPQKKLTDFFQKKKHRVASPLTVDSFRRTQTQAQTQTQTQTSKHQQQQQQQQQQHQQQPAQTTKPFAVNRMKTISDDNDADAQQRETSKMDVDSMDSTDDDFVDLTVDSPAPLHSRVSSRVAHTTQQSKQSKQSSMQTAGTHECPFCHRNFASRDIEAHADRCLADMQSADDLKLATQFAIHGSPVTATQYRSSSTASMSTATQTASSSRVDFEDDEQPGLQSHTVPDSPRSPVRRAPTTTTKLSPKKRMREETVLFSPNTEVKLSERIAAKLAMKSLSSNS